MTNSSNQTPSSNSFKLPFLNQFNEAEVVEWFSQNGKTVLYAVASLVVCLFLLYQFSSKSIRKTEADYIRAANQYTFFSRGENEEESLRELLLLMNTHPELHAAYDGAIAQALLNLGEWEDAKPLVAATLKRTESDGFTLYQQFAEISLLASEQKFSEALLQARALQQEISGRLEVSQEGNERFDATVLFALNLLRIGMLEQQLGDAAELNTWQEWSQYAGLEAGKVGKTSVDPSAFRMISQQLAQGTISLPDYFAQRRQTVVEK